MSKKKTNKYLVTGACGFIASKVTEFLLKNGHKVIAIDNFNSYYDKRLKKYRLENLKKLDAHGNLAFFEGDIRDAKLLSRIFNEHRFKTVFNLAAQAGVRYSMEKPQEYLDINLMGVLNILEELKNESGTNLVQASTSSLYAGQPTPFDEVLDTSRPLSPYAASKKAAEVMCYSYFNLYGINTLITRYFTVYGPAGRPDMSPYRFIKWIMNEEPILLNGDGEQERDFTYVDDIARGTIAASRAEGYEIFNLGGHKTTSMNEFISLLETVIGKKAKVLRQPNSRADMRATCAIINKARTVLKWYPSVDLEEGIGYTVEWFKRNWDFANGISLDIGY